MSILKPGSAAIISIIFGDYIARAIPSSTIRHLLDSWAGHKILALIGLAAVTAVNGLSTKLGAKQVMFSSF